MPVRKVKSNVKTVESNGAAEKTPKFPIALPTENNKPPENIWDYKLCFFGEKGIGKSTLTAKFPGAYNLMWEPGRRNLPIKQIPDPSKNEPPLNWERFKSYAKLFANRAESKRLTMIQDTVDRCYTECFKYVCKKHNVKHPSEGSWGNVWDAITDEFNEVMNILVFSANIGLIFVSHAKSVEVETIDRTYQQIIPTCKDKCWEYLKAAVDMAFYYGYAGKRRLLTVRGDTTIWAACGLEDHFLSPTGEPLRRFLLGESPDQAYKTLLSAYDNKVTEYEPPIKKKVLKK